MELRELRLERLPGLPQPFSLTGASGLNLVLGPNGSGKSSLTRAALGLLWPDDGGDRRCVGIWLDGAVTWRAAQTGVRQVFWQRDGQPHPPPVLPPAHQAACFRLGLLDVLKLQADSGDTGLARAVRNQLAGGYDLRALLDAARPASFQKLAGLVKAAEFAENKVRELQAERRQLRDDETLLGDVRAALQAAKEAAERAEALRLAGAVRAADAEHAAAVVKLAATYPPAMERVQADDGETLKRLRERQQDEAEAAREAAKAIAAAEQDLAAARLLDGGPPPAALEAAKERLAETRQIAGRRDEATLAAARAAAAVDQTRDQLAPWGEPAPDQAVDRARLRSQAGEVKALLQAVAAHDALDRLLSLAALQMNDAPAESAPALAAARRALLDWLAAAGERRWPWLPLAAAAVLLVLGLGLQPWSGAARSWVGWAALAAGLAAAAGCCWPRLRRPRSRRAREAFAETGVAEPAPWTDAEVRRHLARLGEQETAAAFAALQKQLREDLAATRDREAQKVADADPTDRLDAVEWLHRNAAYHEALKARDEANAEFVHLSREIDTRLAVVRRALSAWLAEPTDSIEAFERAVDDLTHRRHDHARALDARNNAESRRAEAERRAAAVARDVEGLLARLGLAAVTGGDIGGDIDADDRVRAYAALQARYQGDKEAAGRLAAAAQLAGAALDGSPPDRRDLARQALDWPAETLDAERQRAEREAKRQSELNDEIVRIEERLDRAGRDATLDQAVLARDRALDALADARDEDRATVLRRLLLERVQSQHRQRSEPPVLQRANALFKRFTDGRYELDVDDRDQESFRARDTTTGEGLALSQLSDGTRAQLLLAARLGYVQDVERGVTVPLFFDESLTAADPARFAAVGNAVLDQIAADGRQVFYLTCDPADVAAWQQLLAGRSQAPAPVIDLAAVRNLAAAAPLERLRAVAPPPVPAPAPGEDPAAYAIRLGDVPPLDPCAPAAAAHLFHLLRDDLPLLQRLLAHRVVQLGQVDALVAPLQADGLLAPAQLDDLRVRARALSVFSEAWRIGRGRPVPQGALTNGSGVSSTKLPEIEDLLASPAVAGDAARLVAALERREVPHLRQDTKAEIADWLVSEGYLDRRPVLAADAVRERVLQAATADLRAGRLTIAALDALLAAWWLAAGE